MRLKKGFLILLFFIMFIPLKINAVNISDDEKICNDMGVQNCGRLRMCSIKTDSNGNEYCGLNDADRDAWEKSNSITRVNCGNLTDIPKKIPDLTVMIVRVLWIIVPIILVMKAVIKPVIALVGSLVTADFKAAICVAYLA